jgi:acetyl esterase/lipase/hemerythrin-like domain-containing protein
MPSLQSQLFNRFAANRVKRLFADFELKSARRELALQDWLVSARPRDVDIQRISLTHCKADWIRPRTPTDRYVVYFPGGAWVLRTPNLHRLIAAKLAKSANANVLLVFYRLAPENPFPSGLEDCVEGYCHLLDSGISASQIVIGGDSAGGNLTLASLLKFRDDGLPLPAAAFALSPCTDMSFGPGGSPMPEDHQDPMSALPGITSDQDPRKHYVAGDLELLDQPYASPARASLKGLCPILIHVGSTELLRDQCEYFVKRAKRAGVHVEMETWEGQPHVWHGMPFPESAAAFGHLSDYIRHQLVSELDPIEKRGAGILQRLRGDHGRFGRVLTMIGRDAWRLIDDPEEILPIFSEAVEYIANYQNVHHHPCEEQIFGLLASKSPDSRAVVKKLTREHEISQRTGQELLDLLGKVSADDQSRKSRVNLADALKDFARNMRAHIHEEEKLLYSEAWRLFTSDDWESVSYEEPGDDPLSGNARSEYPLLSDYVSGNRAQSRVLLRNDRTHERLSQVFHEASSFADRVKSVHELASRQRREAFSLTIKSISAMPLFPLLSPRKTWTQTKHSFDEIRGTIDRWQEEWRDEL